jgi:hypothetical protein
MGIFGRGIFFLLHRLLFFFVFSTAQGRERILDRQDHVHSFLAHLLLSLSLSLFSLSLSIYVSSGTVIGLEKDKAE